MVCLNGEQMQFEGERGIYFICQKGAYEGNHCKFCRWCGLEQKYVMISDLVPCKEFIPNP